MGKNKCKLLCSMKSDNGNFTFKSGCNYSINFVDSNYYCYYIIKTNHNKHYLTIFEDDAQGIIEKR